MRGHVRRRGKGWVYVVDAGRDPETGKRKQKWSRQFPTRRAAQTELHAALGRVDGGDDPVPPKITVTQLFERWCEHMDANDRPKELVRRGYARDLGAHVVPMIGGVEVRKVRPGHVQACLDRFAEGHQPRTVQRLRAATSSLFTFAVRMGVCEVNPVSATSTPTPSKPKLTIPEPGEVRRLIEAAIGTDLEVAVLLAAVTGARRSEVLAVRWSAIDFDVGSLRIEQTLQRLDDRLVFSDTGKTSHAARTIPLPEFTVAKLKAHKADQARRRLAVGAAWADLDLVVERGDGQPLDPGVFSHRFRRHVAPAAGVDCTLHSLRHAFATRLARSGLHPVETSEILGHASPAFTANVYQHSTSESFERTRGAIEEAFGRQ
jgi:integrase